MENIKVLHVYRTCYPYTQGGIEEVIRQLCHVTAKLGVTNRIVCLSEKCKAKEIRVIEGVEIHCYPLTIEMASCGFSWQLWWDYRLLSKWADVIHFQFPWPFADFLALTRQLRYKKYIVSYQSDIVRQKGLNKFYLPLMNRFLDKASAIVATSTAYVDSSPVLSQRKAQITVIPNGMNDSVSSENYRSEKEIYRRELANDFFLFIGVFRYYKGIKYLLEAAEITKAPLVLIGDGTEADSIRQYISDHNLHNITLLGQVSEEQKYALIDLATALILPSSHRSEAYGMVLVEAARQGKAQISTELASGTSYINQHEETGLVVPPQDAPALAEAMTILRDKPDLVRKMNHAAYKRYKTYFTAEKMGDQYYHLYQALLAKDGVLMKSAL